MNTLQLTSAWDLAADASGNIAMATGAAALAQDVASAIRVFQGEIFYDTTQGVPYMNGILGEQLSRSFIQDSMNKAALQVPGVAAVKTTLNDLDPITRLLTGTVEFVDTANHTFTINF